MFQENSIPNFPLNELKLISVGSINENKNQTFQIDVLHELITAGKEAKLTIVGDGPSSKALEAKVSQLNLTKHVSFIGNTRSPQDYLRTSQIFIHTPLQEGFGIAIVEAMASGLPVICCKFKGSELLVQNGITGFISEYSPKEFAKKILQVTNQNTYITLRKNGLEASKSFHTTEYVNNTLKFYTELINS